MEILYKPPFRKFVKKQSRGFQLAIEDEVRAIGEDPATGEQKKGDLARVRVHKFNFHRQEYLIAYVVGNKDIVFYAVGTHENFYRELKRYLKEG
ncbi:MAG TPA: type II toxin-antitoxin system RelE/ParE family toxin [Thermodesulfovibrionales bacterium]|nr:type II toxin-antitoxin system RelE/ParE family toxin [Thermodesulfovibrionales bacterium]